MIENITDEIKIEDWALLQKEFKEFKEFISIGN